MRSRPDGDRDAQQPSSDEGNQAARIALSGRLSTQTTISGTGDVEGRAYAYDWQGRVSDLDVNVNGANTLAIDTDYTLEGWLDEETRRTPNGSGGWVTSVRAHAYDDAGNRLSTTVNGVSEHTWTYLAGNQLDTVDGVATGWNPQGEMTDDRGYAIDRNPDGSEVMLSDGAASVAYDILRSPGGDPVATDDGASIRYQGWGNPEADLPMFYSEPSTGASEAIVAIEGMELGRVGVSGLFTPVATDGLGSLVLEGDTFVDVPEAFGAGASANVVGMQRHVFAGLESLPGLPFQLPRARVMDPTVGRFTSGDPIGLDGGDHRFIYANNEPTGLVDPGGLKFGAVAFTAPFNLARENEAYVTGAEYANGAIGMIASLGAGSPWANPFPGCRPNDMSCVSVWSGGGGEVDPRHHVFGRLDVVVGDYGGLSVELEFDPLSVTAKAGSRPKKAPDPAAPASSDDPDDSASPSSGTPGGGDSAGGSGGGDGFDVARQFGLSASVLGGIDPEDSGPRGMPSLSERVGLLGSGLWGLGRHSAGIGSDYVGDQTRGALAMAFPMLGAARMMPSPGRMLSIQREFAASVAHSNGSSGATYASVARKAYPSLPGIKDLGAMYGAWPSAKQAWSGLRHTFRDIDAVTGGNRQQAIHGSMLLAMNDGQEMSAGAGGLLAGAEGLGNMMAMGAGMAPRGVARPLTAVDLGPPEDAIVQGAFSVRGVKATATVDYLGAGGTTLGSRLFGSRGSPTSAARDAGATTLRIETSPIVEGSGILQRGLQRAGFRQRPNGTMWWEGPVQ